MTDVRVPTLPESVTDATVLTWHKKPGDPVSRDENLLDLETDKVVLEVPSPIDGVLTEIKAEEGAVVTSDDILAILTDGAVAAAAPAANEPAAEVPEESDDDPILTPAVRRLVKEMKIDPSHVTGTGKEGRILKSDVMRYLDEQKNQPAEAKEAKAAASAAPDDIALGPRDEKRVPMSRLRARVAERLLEAQANAAILTTFNEVDLQNVIELRKKFKDQFEKQHDTRLGFMSFFVKAAVEALKKFPAVNASIDGDEIVYHNYFDIGIAVGSPRGLVVPILRDADQMSFAEIEARIREYGEKARDGSLSYDDLVGGTFTISNGGVYGSMLSTPIINPPQSAILGMHNIVERPVVINGEVKIRPIMYLALSYDHRIIDGKESVSFLVKVKEMLENPAWMLFGGKTPEQVLLGL